MDPDACYARWLNAVRDLDTEEAQEAHRDLSRWLRNGGFAPRWTEQQRAQFMKAPRQFR